MTKSVYFVAAHAAEWLRLFTLWLRTRRRG